MANGKAGRSFGTDGSFVLSKKIVDEALKTKKWVSKNVENARNTLEELLLNKETPDTIRRGVAEYILNKHDKFYKDQGGKIKKIDKKKKEPTMSLTFNKTGTEND